MQPFLHFVTSAKLIYFHEPQLFMHKTKIIQPNAWRSRED